MEKTKTWLSKTVQVIAIATAVLTLLSVGVRTTDLAQQTALRQDKLEERVEVETNERKQADEDIREAMHASDKSTQAQLSEMRTEQAVMANDIKYIIKILDGGIQ